MFFRNGAQLSPQGVILHLCFAIMSMLSAAKSSPLTDGVDFLRNLVSPVAASTKAQSIDNQASDNRTPIRKLTREELKKSREEQRQRRAERKARAQASLQEKIPNTTQPVQQQKQRNVKEPRLGQGRNLGWMSGKTYEAYSEGFLADPSQEYDKWAQAYRLLGGYIDCDHPWGQGGHSHEEEGGDNDQEACSRWMIYATVSLVSP